MNSKELLALQGVDIDVIPKNVVTDRQLRQINGNAITISTLGRVLSMVLAAAGREGLKA